MPCRAPRWFFSPEGVTRSGKGAKAPSRSESNIGHRYLSVIFGRRPPSLDPVLLAAAKQLEVSVSHICAARRVSSSPADFRLRADARRRPSASTESHPIFRRLLINAPCPPSRLVQRLRLIALVPPKAREDTPALASRYCDRQRHYLTIAPSLPAPLRFRPPDVPSG